MDLESNSFLPMNLTAFVDRNIMEHGAMS